MGVQQHWSTTASSNDSADPTINWRANQAPSTYNKSARAMMAAIKKSIADLSGSLVTGGSSTAFTLSTNEGWTSLVDGMELAFRFHTSPGANSTLSPDGLTAKPIYSLYGTPLPAGAVLVGAVQRVVYVAAANSGAGAWLLHTAAGILTKAIGEVFSWPVNGALPPLCLEGLGQAVSRTTYSALFTQYGTAFGAGDGSTTFNLPDFGGRSEIGRETAASRVNAATGIDTTTVGSAGGEDRHTLSGAESGQKAITSAPVTVNDPGHTHSVSGGTNAGTGGILVQGGGNQSVLGNQPIAIQPATTGITAALSLAASAASNAHNNMQPSFVTRKIIFAGA